MSSSTSSSLSDAPSPARMVLDRWTAVEHLHELHANSTRPTPKPIGVDHLSSENLEIRLAQDHTIPFLTEAFHDDETPLPEHVNVFSRLALTKRPIPSRRRRPCRTGWSVSTVSS